MNTPRWSATPYRSWACKTVTAEPSPVREEPPSAGPGEWGLWVDWCAATGRPPLPLSVETVLEFAAECPAAPATLTKRVRMIDRMAVAAGWSPLERTDQLRDVLRGRPARPVRQIITAEQVDAALRVLPSHGWTQGWFGRRDRALLVLAYVAGLSYRQIARLTVGDVTFTADGAARVSTAAGPVTIPPVGDPIACGPCALARWVEAMDVAVTFQRVGDVLEGASQVTTESAHTCTTAPSPDRLTLTTALLAPADRWGATAIEPEPLRPPSLSRLARDHGAGRHPPHRVIQRRRAPLEQPRLSQQDEAKPVPESRPYTQADWQAGVDRRHADRERLAGVDALLDDLDEKAEELERRSRALLTGPA